MMATTQTKFLAFGECIAGGRNGPGGISRPKDCLSIDNIAAWPFIFVEARDGLE
jgi:hypothetical protein